MLRQAEYIWMDGAQPTQELRSKTRIVSFPADGVVDLTSFPAWGFDGSSTYQADGSDSDLTLEPVSFVLNAALDQELEITWRIADAEAYRVLQDQHEALQELERNGLLCFF